MISSKPDKAVGSPPLDGAELRALIEAHANREVQQSLGTSLSFQNMFTDQCQLELDRLSMAVEGVLERETRGDLDRFLTTLRAIVRSCITDRHDIDEELMLPHIIKTIADATHDYAHAISVPLTRSVHRETLLTFQRELKHIHLPWSRKLLDRMTLNDSLPAAERLSLSTVFFTQHK